MNPPDSDIPSSGHTAGLKHLPTTLPAPAGYFEDENNDQLHAHTGATSSGTSGANTRDVLRMEVQNSLRLLAASSGDMAAEMTRFLEHRSNTSHDQHIVDSYRYLGELTTAFATRKLTVRPENVAVVHAAVGSINENFLFEVRSFLNTFLERLNRLLCDLQKEGVSNILLPSPGGFQVSKAFEKELGGILDDFLRAYNVLSVDVLSSLSDEYRQVRFDQGKDFDDEILVRFKEQLDPSSPAYDLFSSALPTKGSGLEEIHDAIVDYQSLKDITESQDHVDVQKMRLKIYRLLKFYFMHIKNSLAAQCMFAITMADDIFESEAQKAETYLTILNKIVRVGAFAQLILQLLDQK